MKQLKFNELPMADKALLVSEFGDYLYSMYLNDYRVHLYSLNSHFVEVYFNKLTAQVDRIQLAEYWEIDKYCLTIHLKDLR